MVSSWLISENWLEKYLEFYIKRTSAIVIIVNISKKIAKLYSKKLRFGKAFKILEKY